MLPAKEALNRLPEGTYRLVVGTRPKSPGRGALEKLIETDGLLVVGAEYSLETGEVACFDGMPKQGVGSKVT